MSDRPLHMLLTAVGRKLHTLAPDDPEVRQLLAELKPHAMRFGGHDFLPTVELLGDATGKESLQVPGVSAIKDPLIAGRTEPSPPAEV